MFRASGYFGHFTPRGWSGHLMLKTSLKALICGTTLLVGRMMLKREDAYKSLKIIK